MTFKPTLAYTVKDFDSIRFPVLASPKLDGIRCILIDGVAYSRSMKPIPNRYVQERLSAIKGSYDGELIVGAPNAPDVFNKTTSGVMSRDGQPEFTFHVFDDPTSDNEFAARLAVIQIDAEDDLLEVVSHKLIRNAAELSEYEAAMVEEGYEGIMIRDPKGAYKQGRSTEKEGILGKVKRFEDAEATIVAFEEMMHNENEAKINEIGLTDRSTSKEGLVAADTLGAMVVSSEVFTDTFKIGTGFDAAQRKAFWGSRDDLMGKTVKFKFQPHGTKDRPRLPVFLGFRAAE